MRKRRRSPTPEEAAKLAQQTALLAGRDGLSEEMTRELHEQFKNAHSFEQTELLHGWQTFALVNRLNIGAYEARGILQMGRKLRLETNPLWEKVVSEASRQFNYYIKRTGPQNADNERVADKPKRKK